jgi:hypothetical protein
LDLDRLIVSEVDPWFWESHHAAFSILQNKRKGKDGSFRCYQENDKRVSLGELAEFEAEILR